MPARLPLQQTQLPDLPPHAAYVRHPNECYDWGSYGWLLLRTGLVAIQQYQYFFFVNSSVRGPFLPAYARVSVFAVLGVDLATLVCCAPTMLRGAGLRRQSGDDINSPRHMSCSSPFLMQRTKLWDKPGQGSLHGSLQCERIASSSHVTPYTMPVLRFHLRRCRVGIIGCQHSPHASLMMSS